MDNWIYYGTAFVVIIVFFLLPFWIMAVMNTLCNVDWRDHYWTIIQLQLIIGWLTNHNRITKG